MENIESSNVVTLSTPKRSLTLIEILKKEPEIRGFFRYVKRYDLRLKALEALEKKLYLSH